MKATFARIRFRLPRDRRLNSDLNRLVICHAELPTEFEIVAAESGSIGESESLVLRSSELTLFDDASNIGGRALLAVLLAATRLRVGVDLGKDAPKSMLMKAGLEAILKTNAIPEDAEVLNDFLGLTLVDATRPTVFARMEGGQGIIGKPIDRFVDAFIEGFLLTENLSERSQLALELFSASRFEASLQARFLILISAIESITIREERSDDVQELLLRMKGILNSANINETDRDQIAWALRDLKRRSITSSSKALVESFCGEEKARLFVKCYQARSQLVHNGRTGFDLGAHLDQLEELVAEAIMGYVLAAGKQAP
jgi:hypothetical protein